MTQAGLAEVSLSPRLVGLRRPFLDSQVSYAHLLSGSNRMFRFCYLHIVDDVFRLLSFTWDSAYGTQTLTGAIPAVFGKPANLPRSLCGQQSEHDAFLDTWLVLSATDPGEPKLVLTDDPLDMIASLYFEHSPVRVMCPLRSFLRKPSARSKN